MRKHHPDNERVKRRYFLYLRDANRLSEATVDQTAAAIAAFEDSTGYRDFRRFHIEQAQRFKRVLAEQVNPATGKPVQKPRYRVRADGTVEAVPDDEPLATRDRLKYEDEIGRLGRELKAAHRHDMNAEQERAQ